MIDLNKLLDSDKRLKTGLYWVGEKDFDTALGCFESVLDLDPKNISALCNTAFIAMKQKQQEKAEFMVEAALAVDPENAHALGIAAMVAQETPNADKFEVARGLFEHSLKNDPADVTRHLNYAYMLQLVGDYPRALEIYTQARNLNIMDMSARFQRSMCFMTIAETPQQWKEALDEYEIRHLIYAVQGPNDGTKIYTGDAVPPDSTLLICNEQGIGDSIMMGRYVRSIKERFKKVYFLCKTHWMDLMARVEGIDGVYTDLKSVPKYDFYVPCLSLMRATGYPAIHASNTPYIKRSSVEFGSKLPGRKLKVGLGWMGNPDHGNDRWRSIGPDLFSDAFAGIKGAEFYSLHTQEINRFKPEFVHDCNVSTLGAVADVIQSMDVIVTVDTAFVHIAGGLGIPAYVLLPSNPDWRWQLKSTTTDWYPSIRLLRSDKPLNWKPVLEEAATQVNAWAQMHRSETA